MAALRAALANAERAGTDPAVFGVGGELIAALRAIVSADSEDGTSAQATSEGDLATTQPGDFSFIDTNTTGDSATTDLAKDTDLSGETDDPAPAVRLQLQPEVETETEAITVAKATTLSPNSSSSFFVPIAHSPVRAAHAAPRSPERTRSTAQARATDHANAPALPSSATPVRAHPSAPASALGPATALVAAAPASAAPAVEHLGDRSSPLPSSGAPAPPSVPSANAQALPSLATPARALELAPAPASRSAAVPAAVASSAPASAATTSPAPATTLPAGSDRGAALPAPQVTAPTTRTQFPSAVVEKILAGGQALLPESGLPAANAEPAVTAESPMEPSPGLTSGPGRPPSLDRALAVSGFSSLEELERVLALEACAPSDPATQYSTYSDLR